MHKKDERDLTSAKQSKRFKEVAKKHEIEKLLPEIQQVSRALALPPITKLGVGVIKKHRARRF